MPAKARVHERVHEKHTEISEQDVMAAWENLFRWSLRETERKDYYVAVGMDQKGRLLEMVAAVEEDGTMVIFHAMTPPSKKTLREVGLTRER